MKIRFLAAVLLSLASAAAPAHAGDRSPVKPPPYGVAFAFAANFKSTDGTSGTVRQFYQSFSTTSSSTTVTYTRNSDHATRTEITTGQTGPDGARTETFTSTDYNAPSSFTSSRTITELGRGQYSGQGTYTTAEGVSGTLTTLETQSAPGVNTITFVYTSATAGTSTEQRTQTEVSGKTVIKTARVDASGRSTSVVQTRILNSEIMPIASLTFP